MSTSLSSAVADPEVKTDVRLNDQLASSGGALVMLEACPACEARARSWPRFLLVRGARGSEGEGVRMPAVRCPACGFVFLNPRLSSQAVADFYRGSTRLLDYFTTGFKEDVDRNRGFLPFVDLIERQLPRRSGGPSPAVFDLFDLGCGTGSFMRLMKDRGFRVAGAEIAPSVAAHGRETLGLDIMAADADQAVETLQAQGRSFDVVTMIHAFEHLPDPLRVLRKLRAIVRPGGLVAINVPNVRYLPVPVDRALGTNLAQIWDPVGHFSYFSLATLRGICDRAGFEVVAEDSRFLVYGRTGALGFVDDALSFVCRRFGGLGSNIALVARAPT